MTLHTNHALQAFRELPRPPRTGAESFRVARMVGSRHLLAKDSNGAPAVLIRVPEAAIGRLPPLALEHLSVQHSVRCQLAMDEAPADRHEGICSVVRCTSTDVILRECFVRVVVPIAEELSDDPSPEELVGLISKVVELFRALAHHGSRTAQGLWAELVVLAFASDPDTLADAWRRDPDEGFDFASGAERVEVKSASRGARIHSFAQRQLRPGPDINVVVASLFAERAGNGATILDVLDLLRVRGLSQARLLRIEGAVIKSLGSSAAESLLLRFDLERGRATLRFFEGLRVPAIELPLPPGVISVHFESVLDESTALDVQEMARRGRLFASCVPSL